MLPTPAETRMLRRATASDAPAIRTLMERVPGFRQPEWSDQIIDHAIRSADGLALVWEESEVLGFVCAHDLGFRAYLSELIVDPAAQHRGIGARLVLAVEDALRE